MESVPVLLKSAVSRWRAWSSIQRTVFGFAAGVILLGAIVLGFQSETTRYVPLSLGKQFSPDDLAGIEQSLREKQLTTYRREGNQLLVPENEQTAYDAALLQEQQLPQDWASEWEQKFEETNPFTSSRELRMLKEIALAKELKRIIQGLDGVAEANVVWAETESQGWPSRQQKVTASVNLRPERGQILSEQTIRAIQFSVANMVPNLEPQDVIVFDYSAGRHYQLRPEQARFETELQQWIDREVARWHERLHSAVVHYWPEAQLLIRPRQEEFRQFAWRLLQSQQTNRDRNGERSLQDIEFELQNRFPEYIQLAVTLRDMSETGSSATPAEQPAIEEEVLASLIGWLPASFDSHQLEVKVESAPADATLAEVASIEKTIPSWQPVIMVGAAGVLLLLVSRRYRNASVSEDSVAAITPEKRFEDSARPVEPTTSSSPAPPITPLGDPELVADVLKQWLGSSHAVDESCSSARLSSERD